MSGQSGYLVSGAYENLVPVPIRPDRISSIRSDQLSSVRLTRYRYIFCIRYPIRLQKKAGYPVSEKSIVNPLTFRTSIVIELKLLLTPKLLAFLLSILSFSHCCPPQLLVPGVSCLSTSCWVTACSPSAAVSAPPPSRPR